MPEINYIAIIVAGLVPNMIGAIYYGPLFGKKWLDSLGFTEEDLKGRKEVLIYGSAFVLSTITAFFMKFLIELTHKELNASGELILGSFHSFKHGAFHGFFLAVGLVLPVIICLGMFQKQKSSNILINSIYWVLCYAIMGGILDMWL